MNQSKGLLMESKNDYPVKLTKNCLYPWQFLQVHAGGMMQCCAVGNDTDLGDFIIDHCEKLERGEAADVLNSPGLQALRKGLLTGNLRPMCRKCFFVDDKLVSTDILRTRLLQELKPRFPAGTDLESLDLTRVHMYKEMAISFTNKCNLRCVYCIQSTQANVNPYFKVDFPEKYAESTLDFFAQQGILQIRSCVEGEPTIYKRWYEVFSAFNKKYPHISLYMTTNLCRHYTDDEIGLLAQYAVLDVSCDTLDPALYHKLRYPGKIELVLENLERITSKAQALGIPGPRISLHAVVSDLTWPTLEKLADFALERGYLPFLGNYEERANSVACQQAICRPLSAMPADAQVAARDAILRIRDKMRQHYEYWTDYIQGGLLYNLDNAVLCNYNRFEPYDNNPLHGSFYAAFPSGNETMHFDVVYDYDHVAHNGILFSSSAAPMRLEGLQAGHMVVREVSLFSEGHCSHKYGQTVLPGYRRTVAIENGVFEYTPAFAPGVEKVLLEAVEWW